MRNDIGYFLTSISSSTQQGWIIGVLSRATSGVAASASPELSGPQMMLTFWRCVSSATAFTALVGSLWVSRTTSSILRPLMPPAALISSTARMVPRLMPTPVDELGPVSAGMKPILIGSLAAMAGLARPEAKEAAPAADPAKTWRRVTDILFPPMDFFCWRKAYPLAGSGQCRPSGLLAPRLLADEAAPVELDLLDVVGLERF